jgi:outer membrane protein
MLCLVCAVPAAAQPPAEEGPIWSVGAGAVFAPRPYEGMDAEVFPIPVVGVRYRNFYWDGIRAGFRFSPAEHLGLDLFAAARFDGYEEDDSDAVRGMAERRLSADLGFRVSGEWERVETGLSLRTDVLDRSDGQEVEADVSFPMEAGSWRITPGLAVSWLSDDLVDYYYGVRPGEALPDRPGYEGEDTLNLSAEVAFLRPFADGRWLFLAGAEAVWFGSEIRDSPIVDDDLGWGGRIAIVRRFGGKSR